jgi:hypothetical protein
MDKEKIYTLINECRKDMLEIDETFYGSEKTKTHEKEEAFYRHQFEKLNIQPSIVPKIYSFRNNNSEIQNIKDNLEQMIIEK